MTTDRIFVLMLVIMLPMSGCFGGVGDAEADDSTDGTTVINNYYNNTTTVQQTNSQQPIFYSSGGTEYYSWDEYGISSYGNYNSSHPNYVFETYNDHDGDYNVSECLSKGGFVDGEVRFYNNKYRPVCSILLVSINTSAGQALVIHEWTNFELRSSCNNVETEYNSPSHVSDYVVSGSALNCTHDLVYSMSYSDSEDMMLWSVMYSIQPTIVV